MKLTQFTLTLLLTALLFYTSLAMPLIPRDYSLWSLPSRRYLFPRAPDRAVSVLQSSHPWATYAV